MRGISLLQWLAVISLVEIVRGNDVVVLTDENFDEQTKDGVWMVKFHAPWCGHCKSLAPTFNNLAKAAEGYKVGKVDCTAEKSTASRLGILAYPTLKVITNGRSYDYSSERTVDAMHRFSEAGYKELDGDAIPSTEEIAALKNAEEKENENLSQDSGIVILSNEDFEKKVVQGSDPWIVKFYAPWCGHCKRLAPIWHKLSATLKEKHSRTKVGKVDCTYFRRSCSRASVGGYPTLVHFKDGEMRKYNGVRNLQGMLDFVEGGWENEENLGPVPQLSYLGTAVDSVIEWGSHYTFLAVLVGIALLAIMVAILIAILDYCMGDDDQEEDVLPPSTKEKKIVDGEDKAE